MHVSSKWSLVNILWGDRRVQKSATKRYGYFSTHALLR
jgi:hypothetical protein